MMATAAVTRASRSLNKRTVLVTASRYNSTSEGGGESDPKAAAKSKLKDMLTNLSTKKKQPSRKPVDLAKPSLKEIDGDVVDVKGIEPEVVHAVSRVARAAATAADGNDDDEGPGAPGVGGVIGGANVVNMSADEGRPDPTLEEDSGSSFYVSCVNEDQEARNEDTTSNKK